MYSKECFLNDYAKPLAAKDHAIYEIILRSANGPRKNWDHAFKKMAQEGDDQLLHPETDESPNNWDETEWTW